uniref:G-protein coupled receptors family 1 profile domain-containing protein n=2 Tax=Ciona intestinalis TaxID=7719 RepID=H2XSA4_CIOIN
MMSLCLIYLALFVVRSHGGSVSELQEPPQPKQATNTDVSISVVVENIKVWSMVNNRAKRSTQLSVESRNTFPKNQITDQHPGNPDIMDLISLISLLLLLPVWCLVFWTLDVYQTYERDDLTLGWKLLLILFSILNIPMFVYLVFEIRTKKNQKRVSPKSCFGKDWNCWFIFCVFLPLLLGIIMFRMWYSKIFKPYNLREPKHRVLLSIYIVLGFPMLVYYLVDYCTYVKKNNGSTTRPSFPNPTTTTMG